VASAKTEILIYVCQFYRMEYASGIGYTDRES